jgi:hypothetical protein
MAPTSRWALLTLVLLAGSSSLESSPPAQRDVPTVQFSPGAGTFVGSEMVSLGVQGRATIHYTLDGSLPTANSPVYREPITLDTSTRLRAVAVVPDAGRQGPVATEIYLRVDPEMQSFTSHLPIILIHTFESGTLDRYGTEHVAAAIQVFEPNSGTTRLVGRATLDARIGIHVRGQSTRNFPKNQYALELRADDDDSDRDRSMLGLPSHSEWVLHDSVYIVNALTKNVDALRFSAYFHKDRGGRLAAGPVWDFDRSLGSPYDVRATDPEEWRSEWSDATDYFNEGWWRVLFRDPDFTSRYRTRFTALLNGEFSPDNLDRIVDGFASQVGEAADRNFRRWSQFPPTQNSHAAEIVLMKDFLRRRVAWIRTRLQTF